MTIITITISIDAGDDARVTVNGSTQASEPANGVQKHFSNNPEYIAPFQDELVPLPDGAMPLPNDPAPVFRGSATGVVNGGLCPVHHLPWKVVPAGISKRTGKAYDSFTSCPERGCDQRPAR